MDLDAARRLLADHGQAHLLDFWPRLDEARRAALLADIAQIDLPLCDRLVASHVRRSEPAALPARIEPVEIWPATPDAARQDVYRRARELGEEAVRAGRVAAFMVAGGQGTRLGFDGPKGMFSVSPVRGATLFQLFAEGLARAGERWGRPIPWYIMTSDANHDDTVRYFSANRHFGLSEDDVRFFQQGMMPAFFPDGRIVLAEPHRVALSPDGHGGSLRALAASGALDDMRRRGVEVLSYFQVDNPLVQMVDPLFIGLHLLTGSEMSSKAVTKAHDLERVGNFCRADGKVAVIEYSDLPESLARARNADGGRRFDAGSLAIHVLSREFIERLTTPGSAVELPWHRAEKKVPTIDADGRPVSPDRPNAIKLEMFIFDAIPLARNPLVLYTRREEEFSPVKNAEGDDSPATARRDMIRRAARWLEAAGVAVPRGADGEPAAKVEISPRLALDADDLRARLRKRPELRPGDAVVIE